MRTGLLLETEAASCKDLLGNGDGSFLRKDLEEITDLKETGGMKNAGMRYNMPRLRNRFGDIESSNTERDGSVTDET